MQSSKLDPDSRMQGRSPLPGRRGLFHRAPTGRGTELGGGPQDSPVGMLLRAEMARIAPRCKGESSIDHQSCRGDPLGARTECVSCGIAIGRTRAALDLTLNCLSANWKTPAEAVDA